MKLHFVLSIKGNFDFHLLNCLQANKWFRLVFKLPYHWFYQDLYVMTQVNSSKEEIQDQVTTQRRYFMLILTRLVWNMALQHQEMVIVFWGCEGSAEATWTTTYKYISASFKYYQVLQR